MAASAEAGTRRAWRQGAAALACAAAFAAAGFYDETVLRVPVVSANGRADPIEVTLFRPREAVAAAVVILSHGSPRDAQDRRRTGRLRFEAQSRVFAAMGHPVAVPTRRGYGDSGGAWSEGYGSCEQPDYHRAGLETARDIRATIDALRKLPDLKAERFVLVGLSAGGWGSVAASTLPIEGLLGVVSFAGGRGSYGPNRVCADQRLVEAAARYGREARVPQLWIYSVNDLYFGPALARRMHAAFVAEGGRAEFFEAPPAGADGHEYFARTAHWKAPVEAFLRRAVDEENLRRSARPTKGS